jgi:nucleoside-diphosphate-sugar epimerase
MGNKSEPRNTANILIAGCGDIGSRLGVNLAADGHKVWGLKRNTASLAAQIQPLPGDLASPDTLILPTERFDYVFYTAAAGGYSETQYRAAYVDGVANLLAALAAARQQPRRILLVSSTSVYAQQQGEWVDEDSPAASTGFSGRCIREGEELLWSGPYPATVIRFGGIYGPGRTRLIDSLRDGTARCVQGAYSNRIHSQDCARALQHLMALDEPESLYLGVDNDPALSCDVMRWVAERLGVAGPQVSEHQQGARKRSAGSKRCSNARLRASGFEFLYPDYQHGYAAMLAELNQ